MNLLRTFYRYSATLLEVLFVDVLFQRKTWRRYVKFHAMYRYGAERSQVILVVESGLGCSAADFNGSKHGLMWKSFCPFSLNINDIMRYGGHRNSFLTYPGRSKVIDVYMSILYKKVESAISISTSTRSVCTQREILGQVGLETFQSHK